MSLHKTGMMVSADMKIPDAEQMKLISEAGFDAFFTAWKGKESVTSYRALAKEYGLMYHSVHGPNDDNVFLTHLWRGGDRARAVTDELMKIVEVCSDNEVGILVSHVHSGFEYELPTLDGAGYAIECFGAIADRACELGVRLALENIESFELNEALMSALDGHPAVGFCWDSGHERCYYNGRDLTENFGDKIIAVHLHDNMGCGSADGQLASRDDMHMLPFDGIIDWSNVARRLDAHGFDGVMMLEAKRSVWYSDRRENAMYMEMTAEEYVRGAYERVKRLASMRK